MGCGADGRVLVSCLVAGVAVLAAPVSAAPAQDPWTLDVLVSGLGGIEHREPVGGGDFVLALRHGDFRMVLGAPLRFDRTGLRKADWDEVGDFGRIVVDAGYGRPDGIFHVRAAPVAGMTLGPGALVSRYFGTLDPDHWRTGIEGGVRGRPAGVDAFVDSFLAPSVVGGRAWMRPVAFVRPDTVWGRLELGFTAAGDVGAPAAYDRAADGGIAMAGAGLPAVNRSGIVGLSGDLRWTVVKFPQAEVTPWGAVVRLGDGTGVHAGLDVAFHPARRWTVGISGEYRRLWSGYAAPYFDTLYAIDRWDLGGQPQQADLSRAAFARSGMAAEARLSWAGGVSWWASADLDRIGTFCEVRSGLTVDAGRVRAVALFAEKGLDSAAAMAAPNRLVFAASVDVRILPVLWWFAAYARDAAVRTDGPDRGLYRPSDTALTGLRVGVRAL
jgi:hypothetical protein